jgi:hypothetical protein
LANPTSRVPYGSMLPFELFLAALFLAWASEQPRIRSWFGQRFAYFSNLHARSPVGAPDSRVLTDS